MLLRDWLVAALVALVTISATAHPRFDTFDGFSNDILFWLRHQIFGQRHAPEASPTVVVAIDEESYGRPPFLGLPKVMWTPQFARIIDELLDAGAKVIGQDLVLPTSVETFIRGYDRVYLSALRKAASDGRIVLSRVQHLLGRVQAEGQTITPHIGQRFAVGQGANIRLVNLNQDRDGVIRSIPLFFKVEGSDGTMRDEPSFALELAARALGEASEQMPDGSVRLAGVEIPGSVSNAMQLNFDSGERPVPVYSLSDLLDCALAERDDFFATHFKDKVVLLGAILDVEDRKVTSQRFIAEPDVTLQGERCVHPVMPELHQASPIRNSTPGVLVMATAVNNLVRQDSLRTLPRLANWAVGLVFVAFAAVLSITISPLWAGIGLLTCAASWTVFCTVLFQADTVLPLVEPLVASGVTLTVLLGYRFTVADQEKRFIRKVFGYYLPPSVVNQLTRGNKTPNLGGETRDLTVWFSDLAGFTELSEGLSPEEIVTFMNRYLTEMTDIVERHGGFVEKYIGDGIIAVFGAPLETPDHAARAVNAAVACQARLAEVTPELGLDPGQRISQRIGLNTGAMLIGNIGSKRRFNYTVMGDSVNLASRLENANKAYGTTVLVSETTWLACRDAIAFREIDLLRVLGRHEPVRVFEPVLASVAPPETHAAFAKALSQFRARDFAKAESAFAALAAQDPVAARFAARAETYAIVPPPDYWDGVNSLDSKF